MAREAAAAQLVSDLIIPSERRLYAAYAHFQRALKAEQLRRLREVSTSAPLGALVFALHPWQAKAWVDTRRTLATIIRAGRGYAIAQAEQARRKSFHVQHLTRVVKDFNPSAAEITIPRGLQEAIQATVATSRERMLRALADQVEETGLDDRDALATRVEALFREWRHGRDAAIGADQGGAAAQVGLDDGYKAAGVELMEWVTAGDERVREAHEVYGRSGPHPLGFNYAPLSGHDDELRFPHDPSCSDLSLTINCRCYAPGTPINGPVRIVSKAVYAGPLWRLETARGYRLTLTANHPVLTSRGWVRAERLREGDDLLCNRGRLDGVTLGIRAPHNQHSEATVEQLFDAFGAHGGIRAAVVGALDLHGEANRIEQRQIHAAFANAELRERFDASLSQRHEHAPLGGGWPRVLHGHAGPSSSHLITGRTELHAVGRQDAVYRIPADAASRAGRQVDPRDSVDALAALVQAHDLLLWERQAALRSTERVASRPTLDMSPIKRFADTTAGGAERFAEFAGALSGQVAPDKLIRVGVQYECYRGPVYDVQTPSGLVHSAGIITHNCVLLPAE